jgi:hypothetical protein
MTDPKRVDVTVIYKPGENPNFEFESELKRGTDNELVFKNDHHPGFWVQYKLDPESFGDLAFPNDETQALSCAVLHDDEDKCPNSGTWDQFTPHQVKDHNRTLVVRNVNGKLPPGKTEVKFGYALFVTDDPNGNGQFHKLDPIGTNENGPISVFR